MKRTLTCILLALSVYPLFSQNEPQEICGYSHEVERILKTRPNFLTWQNAWYKQAMDELEELRSSKRNLITADTVFLEIPVVFHILYNNSSQNIHDSLIYNQITELNLAFRKMTSDTNRIRSIFKPLAADVRIQFRLTGIDQFGNPHSGINRKFTSKSTFARNQFGGYTTDMKDSTAGGAGAWDPTRFLNIWVCNMEFPNPIGIVYGFATPPTGAPNWDNTGNVTKDSNDYESGVVLHYKVTGKANPLAPIKYSEGKTAVHEVGHYLGLRHVWGDGTTQLGCSVDDGIFDTPNARYSNATCGGQNSCMDASNDKPDMTENYMDYALDGCAAMFTKEQAHIMRFVLNNFRTSLPFRQIEFDTAVTPSDEISVKMFPNPVNQNSQLKIQITSQKLTKYSLSIIDDCGRTVIDKSVFSNHLALIDMSEIYSAVYYVIIRDSEGGIVFKEPLIVRY